MTVGNILLVRSKIKLLNEKAALWQKTVPNYDDTQININKWSRICVSRPVFYLYGLRNVTNRFIAC